MIKYVCELNYDIEIFDNEADAVKLADYHWQHMTENEKSKADYFKVYEIDTKGKKIEDIEDFADYMSRMIKNYLYLYSNNELD